jgi:hypothetical protein
MSFDRTRIRRGELIAALSAIALFIVMFLPWYSFHGDNRTRFLLVSGGHPLPITGSAWHSFSNTSLLLIVLIVVALAPAVVMATQQKVNFPLAAAGTALGVLTALLIIYKLFLHRPGGNKYTEVALGGYVGLVAILGITFGAYLTAREDGISWDRQSPAAGNADHAADSELPSADPFPAPEVPRSREK